MSCQHRRQSSVMLMTSWTLVLLLLVLLSPSSPFFQSISRGGNVIVARGDDPVSVGEEGDEGHDLDDEEDDLEAEEGEEEGDDLEEEDAASSIEDQFHMSREELESRMKALFPMMDVDNDQKLSKQEVLDWLKRIHEKVEVRQGKMEFDGVDTNHDELLSLEELNKAYFGEDEAAAKEGSQDILARFKTVDRDGDGMLSPAEFNRLLRVSEEPELLELEVNEILKSQDTNKDGKISLSEFKGPDGGAGGQDDDGTGTGQQASLAKEFEQYDKDKSGFIEPKEVEAIIVEHSGVNHDVDLEDVFRDAEVQQEDMDHISFEKFMKNAENIASSKITDFGEILRFPTEYKMSLPFTELEDMDDEAGVHKEEL